MWVTKAEALAMTAPMPDDCPACLAGLPVVRTAAFRDLRTGRTIVFRGRVLDAIEELAAKAKGEARRD